MQKDLGFDYSPVGVDMTEEEVSEKMEDEVMKSDFEESDTNENGVLTKEEAGYSAVTQEYVDDMDMDK